MIEVDSLTRYYGDYKAIDNLSFNAAKGEILGFLGPNGAGKTTTMRILTGFMPPSAGTVLVAGVDVVEEPLLARQQVGYLPEVVPVYREMTVWQYVDYIADLYGLPGDTRKKRVGEVLEQVDMLDRTDSMMGNLSKGMRQRVGLAQALVHEPEVLILDEPTIGLDPAQVREFREMIRQVATDRTVMLSTHILSEVEQICDRVLIINKGRIIAEDTPAKLSDRLQGGERFRVKVSGGSLEEIASAIRRVPDVHDVIMSGEVLEVISAPDQDSRPAVAARIIANGWELFELRPLDLTLEDIFLQLTTDQQEFSQLENDAEVVNEG